MTRRADGSGRREVSREDAMEAAAEDAVAAAIDGVTERGVADSFSLFF